MQINEHKLYILSSYRPEYPLNSFNYVSVQSTLCVYIFVCVCVCVCVCVITWLLVWCVVDVHANACAIHR